MRGDERGFQARRADVLGGELRDVYVVEPILVVAVGLVALARHDVRVRAGHGDESPTESCTRGVCVTSTDIMSFLGQIRR